MAFCPQFRGFSGQKSIGPCSWLTTFSVVAADNRTTSDGVYHDEYGDEGNRSKRFTLVTQSADQSDRAAAMAVR